MKNDLGMSLVLIFTAFTLLGLGGLVGYQLTHKRDLVIMEKAIKDNIEKNTLTVYATGFVDGLLLRDKYNVIGIADWCNLDVTNASLQCNYESQDACVGYLEGPNQFCVNNVRNAK